MRRTIFTSLRDTQQAEPVVRCSKCKGEVYRDETTFVWDGKEICSDCFKELVEYLMRNDLSGLASMMDVDVMRYV